ncbi:MAG: hypothetical protein PHR36_02490 [Patescibacteria group bacterium]|nr:hypothetical protein [Patescibacteria group bacterium]
MEKYTRKLNKVASHSFSIILPKEIITKYGWKEKQKLAVVDKGHGRLEIRDWRKR